MRSSHGQWCKCHCGGEGRYHRAIHDYTPLLCCGGLSVGANNYDYMPIESVRCSQRSARSHRCCVDSVSVRSRWLEHSLSPLIVIDDPIQLLQLRRLVDRHAEIPYLKRPRITQLVSHSF